MRTAEVLVPILDLTTLRDAASIFDARSRSEVRVSAKGLRPAAGGHALPATALGTAEGLVLVRFADGNTAWVRLPESFEAGCPTCVV